MEEVCSRVLVTTDDGSKGMKGVVTEALRKELEKGGTGLVVTVGPAIMMKFVSDTTRPFGVKTIVSLNPIMVDGTGMCGGCRVSVGGQTLFACTDGPEFDGHLVDWDILMTARKPIPRSRGNPLKHGSSGTQFSARNRSFRDETFTRVGHD